MQSVCALFPEPFFQRIVDLRSELCADPALGSIYDPPFVHMTLQLAEEYDWPGLESALADVARQRQPFEMRTVGVLAFTGRGTTIAIAPYKDDDLAKFHAAVWDAATEFASGRVDPFYRPGDWVPHITVKRCGADAQSFGAAMQLLATEDFAGSMALEAIGVQHDPDKNSLTHYMRLRFPLGGAATIEEATTTDATIVQITERAEDDTTRLLKIRTDDGREIEEVWTAPRIVREMARAQSSLVHFTNARCRIEPGGITAVVPNTPFPVR
jgi:2'-5' RNA ligase